MLPQYLERVRENALRAIAPVIPYNKETEPIQFDMRRTNAGRSLPPYYSVYFLLVELLGFRRSGQGEKVSWSVPIDFNGVGYVIEHRKMGLGVFARDAEAGEDDAQKITTLIQRGVRVAEPFYKWKADEAIQSSMINVKNKGAWLFERYEYWRDQFRSTSSAAIEGRRQLFGGAGDTSKNNPEVSWFDLSKQAEWIAIEAIDAFFSWTEHIFIHIAILKGKITTGVKVAELAEAEWRTKFKEILDLDDPEAKSHYDKLIAIRRQHRNYIAHGAFGKRGEAFNFHSGAGAVPVFFDHRSEGGLFSLDGEPEIADETTLNEIGEFISFLWANDIEPAMYYIQQSGLPLILPMAKDGSYLAAMESIEGMKECVEHLTRAFDIATDMDW